MSKLERQPLVGKYRNYSTYSNSGVDWIGEMPAVWTLKRVKHMFTIRKRIAGELGYDILSVTQRGIVVKDIESGEGQLSMDYSKYQRVKPGDFAMNHMDLLTGYVDISDYDGVTSPDYRVFTLDNTDYFAKYFLYIFQMGYQLRLFFHMGQGASHLGRWRLATDEFNEMVFPVPSCEEQRTIAAFLDYETARIDRLITQQQRLIELLKEKRQAVISHAVTKGLNPNAPMKDSGVEWLGQVPEHWEALPIKYVSWFVGTGGTPKDRDSFTDEKEINWFTPSDFNGELALDDSGKYVTKGSILSGDAKTYPAESVLIVGIGATLGKVGVCNFKFSCNQQINIVTPNRKIAVDFLAFSLLAQTEQMKQTSNASTIGIMNQEKTKGIQIAVPPVQEQTSLIIHLKKKLSDFSLTTSKAEQLIALLHERRTALISAAVTGKIDLRGWTPPAEEVAA
ncbi:restriction endonuclease subunit S [Aeromonas veronii]|uniref:restriction endonuclease subunit S n=1 Tax=Aeromonas veronii TaxID=654 RepID=UPI003BA04952